MWGFARLQLKHMTDLINKVDKIFQDDIQSLQTIVTKYSSVLELINDQKQITYLAYIINICVDHIKEFHVKRDVDKKSWAVIAVKNLYIAGQIKKESDILRTIDDFFKYFDDEFQTYENNHIAVSQYYLELGFVYEFVRKN